MPSIIIYSVIIILLISIIGIDLYRKFKLSKDGINGWILVFFILIIIALSMELSDSVNSYRMGIGCRMDNGNIFNVKEFPSKSKNGVLAFSADRDEYVSFFLSIGDKKYEVNSKDYIFGFVLPVGEGTIDAVEIARTPEIPFSKHSSMPLTKPLNKKFKIVAGKLTWLGQLNRTSIFGEFSFDLDANPYISQDVLKKINSWESCNRMIKM